MKHKTMFDALYYGAVSPWENSKVIHTRAYKSKLHDAGELHKKLEGLLAQEGKELLDEFLKVNGELFQCVEIEKFKEGFMIGSRLMIDTFSDHRYFE